MYLKDPFKWLQSLGKGWGISLYFIAPQQYVKLECILDVTVAELWMEVKKFFHMKMLHAQNNTFLLLAMRPLMTSTGLSNATV